MNTKPQNSHRKGIYFALLTAVISGFSIFINKLSPVATMNPYITTTLKNTLVGLAISLILLNSKAKISYRIRSRDLYRFVLIGIVGGSVPFLLFFKGLSLTTAPSAALIHKTLFIWVSVLAVPFLGEQLGWGQYFALFFLWTGNLFLDGFRGLRFGYGEMLVFSATLLWAGETILAKKLLKDVPALVGAWGRMFFGSLIMLGFLVFTSRFGAVFRLGLTDWLWILLTSAFLLGYATSYYAALKYAPAMAVASILVVGSVITTAFSAIFIIHTFPSPQIVGMLLVLVGISTVIYFASKILPSRKFALHI